MKSLRVMSALWILLAASSTAVLFADGPALLPLRDRTAAVNRLLEQRLNEVLPQIMRRENVDMWLIICREHNEDPVYLTLVPEPAFAARRLSMLLFFDQGEQGVERLVLNRFGIGNYYEGVWNPDQEEQWACLARLVAERNPRRIGINESAEWAFGDGLSASLKTKLVEALGPTYTGRLVSAENLAVGWLEARTDAELEIHHHIVAIARNIIAEAFSNRVITPGVTTTADVRWWMRERMRELGVPPWFHPTVDLQRAGAAENEFAMDGVIRRGDLLHCDLGFTYLRLSTDTQELAYVLREGETEAPAGLQAGLALGNRLQDILTAAMRPGRSGNEALLATLEQAAAAGIDGS
ncbi:MAG: M24 family metallopeptidase, partial [Acidobacteria bacterium]|nr:M24 family metallopeptidase [Acidobacteriota bacterium]